jgi:hypothetical protein
MLVLVAMVAVARAEPPPLPPPPPPPPNVVPPTALEAKRVAGTKLIAPDDATKRAIARSGKDKTISSFKLCVTVDGKVASVTQLKSSGFPAYDQKIIDTIQREWRYSPYVINGKPVPICTAVTFIYSQEPAGDPPPKLTMLKPGSAPIQVLRMAFTKGDTHTVSVDWLDAMAPQKSALHYELAYTVGDVMPDGDAQIELTYRKVEYASSESNSSAVNDHLAKLAGTKAYATITARGLLQDFALAPDVPASLRPAFELDALRPIDEALPEEPVGVGASWQVERTTSIGDIVFVVTTTYEVTAIAGSRVTVKLTQAMDGKGDTSRSHATGNGKAVIDLHDAVPTSVKLDATQDSEIDKVPEHRTSSVTMTAR